MKNQKRRRKENKTNYSKRFKLLRGDYPRVVFRKTNKVIIAEYTLSETAQDKVLIGFTSRELLKFGWPKEAKNSLKSIPAAYLTGYLLGKRVISKKLERPILDIGMIRNLDKSKVYGFLKGLVDSGIEISCKDECFPEEERLEGGSLKNKIPFKEIKSKIDSE